MIRAFTALSLVSLAIACDPAVEPETASIAPPDDFRWSTGECADIATVSISSSLTVKGYFPDIPDWEFVPYAEHPERWRHEFDVHVAEQTLASLEVAFRSQEGTAEMCSSACRELGLRYGDEGCPLDSDISRREPQVRVGYREQPRWETPVEATAEFGCRCQ